MRFFVSFFFSISLHGKKGGRVGGRGREKGGEGRENQTQTNNGGNLRATQHGGKIATGEEGGGFYEKSTVVVNCRSEGSATITLQRDSLVIGSKLISRISGVASSTPLDIPTSIRQMRASHSQLQPDIWGVWPTTIRLAFTRSRAWFWRKFCQFVSTLKI